LGPYNLTITNSNGAAYSPKGISYLDNNQPCGSLLFTTTSQYLTVPSTAAFDFGTGDFTVECWAFGSTTPSAASGWNLITASPNTTSWDFITYNNQLYWNRAAANFLFGGTIAYTQQWNHFAAVRQSGTLTLYINGVSVATVADSYSYSGTPARTFGPGNGGSGGWSMTNVRIVKGTAVYTGNFTPSPRVLQAISGTSILLKVANSSAFITDSSTNAFTLTNVGTVTYNAITPLASIGELQKIYSDGTIAVANYFDETLTVRTAYRYVKWTVTATKTAANLMQASEFRVQSAGVDVSMTGSTVTSNDAGQSSQGPSNLVDNNTATKFCALSSTGPWTFTIDLGSSKTFNGYSWYTANDFEARDPAAWTVSASTDGIYYVTLATVTSFTATASRNTTAGSFLWTV
jgi:hypothetical protein